MFQKRIEGAFLLISLANQDLPDQASILYKQMLRLAQQSGSPWLIVKCMTTTSCEEVLAYCIRILQHYL